MDAEIRKGDLNASYDAIILPADSIAAMTGEAPAAGAAAVAAAARAGGGGGGEGEGAGRQGGTPPAYRSGFGADGVKMLQAFVQKGGTLVTFGQAGDLPIQRFGLPLRNVVAGLPSKEFWSPGSTLRVRFDNRHPLAFGMPREGYALFLAGQPGLRSDRLEPERGDLLDLRRSGDPAERMAARRKRDCEEGRGRLGRTRRRPRGAARIPAATPRSDARHVQAGLQRAVHGAAGAASAARH